MDSISPSSQLNPISLYSWKDLESLLINTPLQNDTLSKLKQKKVSGYDLCVGQVHFLEQIGINSIHEQNVIHQAIAHLLYSQLQIQLINDKTKKSVLIQLENDLTYTVESLTVYIKKLFSISYDIFLFAKDSTEVLSPNVRIVPLLLLFPEKYSCIIVTNANNVPDGDFSDKVDEYEIKEKKKNKSGKFLFEQDDIMNNKLNGYSKNNNDRKKFLFDSKENEENEQNAYREYSNSINYLRGKNNQYPTKNKKYLENRDEDLLEENDDANSNNYNGSKNKKEYYNTNVDNFKIKKSPQASTTSREFNLFKEKEELNSFIQKGYGAYPVKGNINNNLLNDTNNASDNSRDEYKKYSTDKRQYRPYQSSTPEHTNSNYLQKQSKKLQDYQSEKEENKYERMSNDNNNTNNNNLDIKKYSFENKYVPNSSSTSYDIRGKVHKGQFSSYNSISNNVKINHDMSKKDNSDNEGEYDNYQIYGSNKNNY